MEHNLAALEALLFVHGEPLPLKKISVLLKISAVEAEQTVAALKEKLESSERGLALVSSKNSVQLVTKPALAPVIQDFVKQELTEDLTPARASSSRSCTA